MEKNNSLRAFNIKTSTTDKRMVLKEIQRKFHPHILSGYEMSRLRNNFGLFLDENLYYLIFQVKGVSYVFKDGVSWYESKDPNPDQTFLWNNNIEVITNV